MTESPDELVSLLARARRDGPGPDRLASVRARLESQIGPLDAPRPPSPSTLGPKIGLGVLAVLALFGVGGWLASQPDAVLAPERAEMEIEGAGSPGPAVSPLVARDEPTVPQPTAADPIATTPPATTPPEGQPTAATPSDEPSERRRIARRASAEPDEARAADARSTLREEIALLDRAMRAREAGDLARAVEVLEQHRTRFPEGTLTPERDRMLGEIGRIPSTDPGTATSP